MSRQFLQSRQSSTQSRQRTNAAARQRRQRNKAVRLQQTRNVGPFCIAQTDHPLHDLGEMAYVCSKCDAMHWLHEQTDGTATAQILPDHKRLCYGCFVKRAVQLPALKEIPPYLAKLLNGDSPFSQSFFKSIARTTVVFRWPHQATPLPVLHSYLYAVLMHRCKAGICDSFYMCQGSQN